MEFDKIVAIDWSGAKPYYNNIRVAEYCPSSNTVTLVANPQERNWKRSDVFSQYFSGHARTSTLIGIDFAFAYPYDVDEGEYFPGHKKTPPDVRSLWAEVDRICTGQEDVYGGPFYLSEDARFAAYLKYQTYEGPLYDPRLRVTECTARSAGHNPQSVFKCVGSDSVGIGSIAGFRLLHRIHVNGTASIWPFCDTPASIGTTLVEIYPASFTKRAGIYNGKNTFTLIEIMDGLERYGVELLSESPGQRSFSKDERDALVSAAGMKWWLEEKGSSAWTVADRNRAMYEGWIFGI